MKAIPGAKVCALALGALVGGCAHHDMTVEQHQAAAAKEERAAQRDQAALQADVPGNRGFGERSEPELYIRPDETSMTVDARADRARRLERHAREHEQAAQQLERFEDAACQQVSPAQRRACPMLGPIAEVHDIDRGVELVLAPGASARDVLPLMRCHYAFAQAHGFDGGDSCVLYVPGVEFQETPDTRAIDIVGKDAKTVGQIRARAHGARVGVPPAPSR